MVARMGSAVAGRYGNRSVGFRHPRVCAFYYGSSYATEAVYDRLSRFDYVVLAIGVNVAAATMKTVLDGIHQRNPQCVVYEYSIIGSHFTAPNGGGTVIYEGQSITDKLDAMTPGTSGGWWADWYHGGAPPNPEQGRFINNQWTINPTIATTADASGRRFPEWMAQAMVAARWHRKFDGHWLDNDLYYPQAQIDYNIDGVNESIWIGGAPLASSQVLYRDAMNAYRTALRKESKRRQLVGGNAEQGSTVTADLTTFYATSQYSGVNARDTLMMEGAIGYGMSYGYDDYSETPGTGNNLLGSWTKVMDRLQVYADAVSPGGFAVLSQRGGTSLSGTPATPDYQFMRYGLVSSLLKDNVSFCYNTNGPNAYTELPDWFDEFDAPLGEPAGVAVNTTDCVYDRIWYRLYTNGMVVVNTHNTLSDTWTTCPSGYHRFRGTQVPSVNSGASQGASLTLGTRDAVILLKD